MLTGLYAQIPEMIGREKQPQSQEALGEIVRQMTTLRAFIQAAEDQGQLTPSGHYMPNPSKRHSRTSLFGGALPVDNRLPARRRQPGADQHAN